MWKSHRRCGMGFHSVDPPGDWWSSGHHVQGARSQCYPSDLDPADPFVAKLSLTVPNRASCTVAIAFINSIKAGAPLPGHPQWPSESSDITTVRDLLNMPNPKGLFFKPRQQCTKDTHGQLGGTQAGEWPSSFLLLSQHVLFKKHPNPIADLRPAKWNQQR